MSSIEKKYMKLQTSWHLISRLSLDSKAVVQISLLAQALSFAVSARRVRLPGRRLCATNPKQQLSYSKS